MFSSLPGLLYVGRDSFIMAQLRWLTESDVVLLIKPSELRTACVDLPGKQTSLIISDVKSISSV